MFEDKASLSSKGLLALIEKLAWVDHDVSDVERVDQLAALERVKGACAAAQAAVTVAFVTSQERAQAERRRDGQSGGQSGAGDSVRREHLGRGIAGQVALARRESPARGSQHVKLALALVHELPNTYAALASGRLTEARAEIIARESAHLSGPARAAFDTELVVRSRETETETETDAAGGGAGVSGLGSLGDRELTRRVRALAYRADPAAAQRRYEKAALSRRVELRRSADATCRLTAHLPLAQALAANAALAAAADTARALGDPRGKGQVMADTLVERVTGQASAGAVPVEVQLVITDESLFQQGEVPAQVPGYGTVPAAWARAFLHPDPEPDLPFHLRGRVDEFGGPGWYGDEFGSFGTTAPTQGPHPVEDWPRGQARPHAQDRPPDEPPDRAIPALAVEPRHSTRNDAVRSGAEIGVEAIAGPAERGEVESLAERARVWLRRLYTHPTTGQLVAMESTRRVFDGNLRRFLIARDAGLCRTPWCDAPIRHLDHITDHASGGPTTADNGQGLCARCNHTKNHPNWHTRTLARPGALPGTAPHTTETTTPTGHPYRSSAPPLVPGCIPVQTVSAAATPEHFSAFERHLTERLHLAGLRAG